MRGEEVGETEGVVVVVVVVEEEEEEEDEVVEGVEEDL